METNTPFANLTHTFTVPSGNIYTIREQNGADDDVLSNALEAKNLMNLSRFISGIVVASSLLPEGHRLTPEMAHKLPALDRYTIILESRIFSLGQIFEFSYKWPIPGTEQFKSVGYGQDLRELLFDYSRPEDLTEELMEIKPNAIPFYPMGNLTKDITLKLTSGKQVQFDLLTAEGEALYANLPLNQQTKNASLMARNLRVLVDSKFELVRNFAFFSVKDMQEIRREVAKVDPIFLGTTSITNPDTGETIQVPIMAFEGFFYLGEE